MSEEIKRLITSLVEAWNIHDADRVASFYAPDYQGMDVGQATPQRGLEGIRASVAHYLRAFPDLQLTGEEVLVEENRAALVWMAQGTHLGPLLNIPATGRAIQVRGVSVLTVERDKITSGLYIWDVAGMLRSIGLLTEL